MSTEAQARVVINKLLEEAGWRFALGADGRGMNVICEQRVNGVRPRRVVQPNEKLGDDFENAPGGFVDYVLLGGDDQPVGVVEAKRESIEPLTAKEQARAYAESLRVSHIFLSNGLVHYYWDLRQGNPVRVSCFPSPGELGQIAGWQPDPARLAAETVDENYIAVSQDAAWPRYSPAEREAAMTDRRIRLLRDYQLDAIRALQRAVADGRNRFLFEMATGTGKTLLSAAIAKLYLRTGNARRILFLVDRLELENQALRAFAAALAADGIHTVIYKQKRRDWKQAQVVVTTIQSLAARNRFLHEFAPADFQLLVSDEAHRTISGNNRAIFEYFTGAKLGLTATPRDYLKGVVEDDIRQNDPRGYERRLLLDTYRTFGCEDGLPTFRFSLTDAVAHHPPCLVNPVALDARTDITTQMLSENGYVVTVPAAEDGQEQEIVFEKHDYERKFFSDETNLSFARCFLDHARSDPVTGEIGKTICFAVSRRHAAKLVALLNEEAARRLPAAYGAGSFFAVQVTSDIPGAQQMAVDFAHNNLNGKSRWRADEFRDYDTSRTRVCVTVGMMTTGYDCADVLNVILARPIFSPTDFIQIKGRGTRLHTFRHNDGAGERAVPKDGFTLFDFFANCEFFEEDFNYDEKIPLPAGDRRDAGPCDGDDGGGGGSAPDDTFTNTSPDPLASVLKDPIGMEGMRIDREMYRKHFSRQAREAANTDATLRDACESENWSAMENRVRQLLFDKPAVFWNLEKLQEIYRTDRMPSLREILEHLFGFTPAIPTRTQLAAEAFEKYTATQEQNAASARESKLVFEAFLLDPLIRDSLREGKFAKLRTNDTAISNALHRLDERERENLIRYIDANVSMEDFVMPHEMVGKSFSCRREV